MSDKYICYAQIERYDFEHELSDDLQKEDILMVFNTQKEFEDYADSERISQKNQLDWRQMRYLDFGSGDVFLTLNSRASRRHGKSEMSLKEWKKELFEEFNETTRVKVDSKGNVQEFSGFQYAVVKV